MSKLIFQMGRRLESERRRLSTFFWRHSLAGFGAGSTIGPGWRIERPDRVYISQNVMMGRDGWLSLDPDPQSDPQFTIGSGSYVGNFFLAAVCGRIDIGEQVMISDRVFIGDCNHRHDQPGQPIIQQGLVYGGPVTIGAGTWIGVGAAILPGVSIGRNCVIGANAVVTRDVPDGVRVGGIPAMPL